MESTAYQQFAELEDKHFWFRGRREIFFDILEREIGGQRDLEVLEIGCGAGGMLGPLQRFGQVHGMEIARDYVRHCHERGYGRVIQGSGYDLPYPDDSFDLIALFDVIEHIPDDERVMTEVRRVLRPNGHVILSVPAYQFLYSQNDRIAHHQRRYTARGIRRLLRTSEFTPTKLSYFNTFLFPLILPGVLMLKLKERLFGLPEGQTNLDHQFPRPVNECFARVMGSEKFLLRHLSFPFGHSLMAIAKIR